VLAYKLLRGEFQQDYSEQEETARALLHHAEKHNIVFWSLWSNIFTGFAAARGGRPLEGIEMMDASIKVFADMKFTFFRPFHLGLKARAYEIAGDLGNALASTSEAIAFARDSGETLVLADLIGLCGDLHLAQCRESAVDLAEHFFEEAIALAQAQASMLHELRAATSLARLWSTQRRHAEARKVLQPVYNWFTDGLDTPDIAKARAVLRDLAANRQQHETA
jgi:predicted ATPase